MNTALVWFRQDLRLHDHRALTNAINDGHRIVACYVLDDDTPKSWAMGGASRWWLHHALSDLDAGLKRLGGQLILRRGRYVDELLTLIEDCGADALYFSRNYEPGMQVVEQTLHTRLQDQAVDVRRYAGNILYDPAQIRTQSDEPYKVFTPFWKRCLQMPAPPKPLKAPEKIAFHKKKLRTESLDDWQLLPTKPDWAGGLRERWTPTETAAHDALHEFLDGPADAYRDQRNLPAQRGTSRLSPYLHFGQISPATVWHETQNYAAAHRSDGAKTFLSELGWREFSYHLLHQFPKLPSKPFRDQFADFPWKKNAAHLRAWQRGVTGFPIVDAGMRE